MLKTCRAPSAGRRGKGPTGKVSGDVSLPNAAERALGQGLGGRLSVERRGKGPTGKVSGDVSLPNAAERDPRARLGGLLPAERRGKRVVGQDPGVLFPCGSASAPLFCAKK